MKFRQKMMRFWMGRNGTDQLCQTMMWTALVLSVVNLFFGSLILYLIVTLLIGFSAFRMFSRNIYRRQKENQAFLRFFKGIGGWFKLIKNRIRDRKTHVYKKCPHCKRTLRLPKIAGEHTVCCPCCAKRFQMKI